MSEATARARIKTVMETVSNIGNVYDYDRWAAFWPAQIDIIKATIGGTDVLRFWTIVISETPETDAAFNDLGFREYVYKISGAVGLNDADASEKTAVSLAIAIMDALDGDATLHDGQTYYDAALAQLTISEPRQIGTELCNFIEIEQRVTEFVGA